MLKIKFSTFLILSTIVVSAQTPDGGAQTHQENSYKTAITQPLPQSSCDTAFFDGFESGNTSNWTVINGSATATTTSPAVGAYRCELTSVVSSHYSGVYHILGNPLQPSYISVHMRDDNGSQHGPYFLVGDDNVSSNNGLVFIYFQHNADLIRIQNGTTDFTTPFVQGQWYHIELRDINWTNKTLDIYVDSVLGVNDYAFFANSMTEITRMHLWGWSGDMGRYDQIIIDPDPAPVATVDSLVHVACFGDSTGAIFTTTTGGSGTYNYAWNNNDTVDDISALPAGNYQLVVTDTAGCADTLDVTLTENPDITGTSSVIDESVAGNDGSIDLTAGGGVPPYSYEWSNTETTEDINNLTGGTYTVTITDSLGCEKVVEIIVGSSVGITQINTNASLQILSNPTNGLFMIKSPLQGKIRVTDLIGRYVTAGSLNEEFDISNQPEGVYLLQITIDNQTIVQKLVKQ